MAVCISGGCTRCGGDLSLDAYESDWVCLQCGDRRPYKKAVTTIPAPVQNSEKVKVPARAPALELKKTIPYRLENIIYTNGHWYPPNEISFRREQMIFLIKSLPMLQEGVYPRNPIGTGYVDHFTVQKKKGKHRASFETPAQLAAEVETRLELCGQDGLILEAVFLWGKRPEYLMRAFNLDERKLKKRIFSALRYISGWGRKKRSYKAFCSHKKLSNST